MPNETIDANLGDIRANSPAAGMALTTTLLTNGLLPRTQWLSLTARTFTTGVVAQFFLNPYIVVLRTRNLGAATVDFNDFSEAAQDNDAGTDVVWSDQDTLANGDAFFIGSHTPFGGFSVDVDAANGNAATLLIEYWNGLAWTNITATDNTAGAGATLAVDGTITWTVPAIGGNGWVPARLDKAVNLPAFTTDGNKEAFNRPMYWVRWTVSAAMDAATTTNSIHPLNRSTAYAELIVNQTLTEKVYRGIGGIGSVQAKMDAGTGFLIVNVAVLGGEF